MNSLTKENLWQIYFSDNAEWSFEIFYKKLSFDVKNNKKQEIKEMTAVSYNVYKKSFENLK